MHCLSEISKIRGHLGLLKDIQKVRKRLKYGVKEELLPLIRFRNIGRARARKLFNAGIRTPVDIKKADEIVLAKLLGPKVAKEIRQSAE